MEFLTQRAKHFVMENLVALLSQYNSNVDMLPLETLSYL